MEKPAQIGEQECYDNLDIAKTIANHLITQYGTQRGDKDTSCYAYGWSSDDLRTRVQLISWVHTDDGPDVVPYLRFGMVVNERIEDEDLKSTFVFGNNNTLNARIGENMSPELKAHTARDYIASMLRALRTHTDAPELEAKRTVRIETRKTFSQIVEEQDMMTSVLVPAVSHQEEITTLVEQYKDSVSIEDYSAVRKEIVKNCKQFGVPEYLVDYVISCAGRRIDEARKKQQEN